MTDTSQGIMSFVLRFAPRLWQDAQGEPHLQWRGQIRHVQGDEEIGFTDFGEAIAFMQRHLLQLASTSLAETQADQNKILTESFKLWEQFATVYSQMMFNAMEQSVRQSEAVRQQMDQAVQSALEAWRWPGAVNQPQIAETLHRLQAQVEALARKVEELEKAK